MSQSRNSQSQGVFAGQHLGEQLLFRVRKHPVFLSLSLILPTILFCASFAGLILVLIQRVATAGAFSPFGWFSLAGLGGALLWGWLAYLEWGNDQLLITDQRLVILRRVFRLFEERQEAEITRIQDITITFPSVFASALNYGDIDIATFSGISRLHFPRVPKPQLVKEAIFRQREAALEAERRSRRQGIEERLRERLSAQR